MTALTSFDGPERGMELGAFSISSAVRNLEAWRTFCEKFGLELD